ncbi:ABC transporter ATP-binding protein [Erwiniaceae bacterium BAC15a-03b]|uniref:ABC transporter ATP-binding protein n=1 Tax=Winslowiella arboricola TaxID=2978220 RepID=A0A9J6PTR1_9GAMM|nr:ABC transporter ATP-binding protein [Winslowiella arboricola]MCU5772270.1 ABC transporter ATP-binding protein [Winslowiella arboricola]MCU5779851.1 ABC transporter ATP-binding protein [Winslowiella arboricola]
MDASATKSAAQPLLRVEQLHVSFPSPRGVVEAVKSLSFNVNAGEIVALVGESGSGKSVTARTLVGLTGAGAVIDAAAIELHLHDGSIGDLQRCDSKSWRRIRGREIGFILQDALSSLDPLRRIGQEVAEPIVTHRLTSTTPLTEQVQALLTRVGIPDPQSRAAQYPHELSGGLRQRALIASALAAGPRLLIADEPTTALDATVQKQVLAVFKALAAAGHGVLLITHDLGVVADIADRVVVMHNGQQVESGATQQVLSAPQHPYTRRLLSAIPTAQSRGQWLTGKDPLPDVPVSAIPRDITTPVLSVSGLSLSYTLPGGKSLQAVNQLSLQVASGETLGIVGESGSGKTTLGKLVLALQQPDQGDIQLSGHPWSGLKERERRPRRARIQTIVQDPLGSFDPQFTVEQLLQQPLRLHTTFNARQRQQRIRELLALVGLNADLLSRRPTALSGGQRQRVSIAQALACEPDLLVCDEPVSALDVTTQAQVLDLLVALQRRLHLSMLFISHDLGVVQHMSQRIAVMKAGEIVETGSVEQIFTQPRHDYTRLLLSSVETVAPADSR